MKEVSSTEKEKEVWGGEGGMWGENGTPMPQAREKVHGSEEGGERRDPQPYFSEPSPQAPLISLTVFVSPVPALPTQMDFPSSVFHLSPPKLSLTLPALRICFGTIRKVSFACTMKKPRTGSMSRGYS